MKQSGTAADVAAILLYRDRGPARPDQDLKFGGTRLDGPTLPHPPMLSPPATEPAMRSTVAVSGSTFTSMGRRNRLHCFMSWSKDTSLPTTCSGRSTGCELPPPFRPPLRPRSVASKNASFAPMNRPPDCRLGSRAAVEDRTRRSPVLPRQPREKTYASDSIFTKTSPAMISGSPRLRSCRLA